MCTCMYTTRLVGMLVYIAAKQFHEQCTYITPCEVALITPLFTTYQ